MLAYDDQGAGPVVVLLHGFPFDRSLWADQARALAPHYRVILPDLRGHGQSPAPSGIYLMDDLAKDVVRLLDGLSIAEPVVVGGLSMGGYVAQALAVNHPQRLRGLMLINTRAAADTPQTAEVREQLAREVEAAGEAGPIVATMLPKLFSPDTSRKHPELLQKIEQVIRRTSPRGIAGALRGMAIRPNRTPSLPHLTMPTLVIAGGDDQLIPLSESEGLARALPHAQLVVISEAGHLAPIENPAAVNAALLDFLSRLD
jgi:pimeloyl-ACP methyl ester carboxylesterase